MKKFIVITTVIIVFIFTGFFLVNIWFPGLIPENIIMKLFWTYLALLIGGAVGMKLMEYLKDE